MVLPYLVTTKKKSKKKFDQICWPLNGKLFWENLCMRISFFGKDMLGVHVPSNNTLSSSG
jgi:hypothetical protein